jgi:hypothetical protein
MKAHEGMEVQLHPLTPGEGTCGCIVWYWELMYMLLRENYFTVLVIKPQSFKSSIL